jgi:1-acyl-sn-glycerol-3-phosphate acyltransferase
MSVYDLGALAKYHEFTRKHGANKLVYRLSHWILVPAALAWFRLTRTGTDTIPQDGVLLVANHRSFLDPFLLGMLLPPSRPVCAMGKAELFKRPRAGWYISRCGCFPVRRGESDPEATETARQVLERGGVVVIFPEGTRLRGGGLGQPRRGAFRLAIETGATVVPCCVMNTENVRRAKVVIRPVHVQAHAAPPIPVEKGEPTREAAADLADRSWKAVTDLWLEHGGSPEPGTRERDKKRFSWPWRKST